MLTILQEVELGEYVADYAFHQRDLEGEYEAHTLSQCPSATKLHLREFRHNKDGESSSSSQPKELPPTMPRGGAAIGDLDGDTAVESQHSRSNSRGRSQHRVRIEREGDNEAMEMSDISRTRSSDRRQRGLSLEGSPVDQRE